LITGASTQNFSVASASTLAQLPTELDDQNQLEIQMARV
jgi:hypothetical protein